MPDKRTLLMLLTCVLAAATVLWMRGRFDAADQRNALALVQEYRSKSGNGIPALLALRHPERPLEWSTATESSCYQHVRVHAVVTERGREPHLYAFTVDLNGPAIHPGNETARELMTHLDAPPPPAAAAPALESSASASTHPATAGSGGLQ